MMNRLSGGISNLLVLEGDTLMKTKKTFLLIVLFMLIVLLSPRIILLSLAAWDYYRTDITCTGRVPTPPRGFQVPLDIYEIKPFSILTRRGYIFPGDEYRIWSESWFGMANLLWAGKDGATFLITFTVNDTVDGNSRSTCRWFAPLGDYR
jgi:hypothetical protein